MWFGRLHFCTVKVDVFTKQRKVSPSALWTAKCQHSKCVCGGGGGEGGVDCHSLGYMYTLPSPSTKSAGDTGTDWGFFLTPKTSQNPLLWDLRFFPLQGPSHFGIHYLQPEDAKPQWSLEHHQTNTQLSPECPTYDHDKHCGCWELCWTSLNAWQSASTACPSTTVQGVLSLCGQGLPKPQIWFRVWFKRNAESWVVDHLLRP